MNLAAADTTAHKPRFSAMARSIATMAAGASLAQVVAVMAAPVLTRLYSPAQFGVYGLATSAVGIASVVATLRYEQAIPLPEADADGAALAIAASIIAVLVAIVAGVAVFATVSWFGPDQQLNSLTLGVCVAMSVWGIGWGQVAGALAARTRDSRAVSSIRVAQVSAVAAAQIGLGMSWLSFGLIAGDSAGRTVGLVGAAGIVRRWASAMNRARRLEKIRTVMVRYRRFPLVGSWSALINMITLQAPMLGVLAIYGATSGGAFVLVQRVATLPIAVVGVAVSQGYLMEVVAAGQDRLTSLQVQYDSIERRLFVVGTPIAVLAVLLGPMAFPILFGSEWTMAGAILAISAPLYLAQLVTSPAGVTLDVLERQDLHAIRELIRLALVLGTLVGCAFLRPSLEVCTGALTVAGVVGYVVYRVATRRAIAGAKHAAA